MPNNVWLGGAGNLFANPANWDTGTVPANDGGKLYVFGPRIINIGPNTDISRDALQLVGGATVNIVAGSNARASAVDVGASGINTINLAGDVTLGMVNGNPTTAGGHDADMVVNATGTVTGAFVAAQPGSKLTITGATLKYDSSTLPSFDPVGAFNGATVKITSDMIGTGSIYDLGGSQMELGGSVAPSLTFIVGGGSTLQIDNPASFHGMIASLSGSELDLMGLTANGYSRSNGVLTLYQNDRIVDTLAIPDDQVIAGVSTKAGVSIYGVDYPYPPTGETLTPHY
jgi:hypothetical protein